jgi:hypothetical protein
MRNQVDIVPSKQRSLFFWVFLPNFQRRLDRPLEIKDIYGKFSLKIYFKPLPSPENYPSHEHYFHQNHSLGTLLPARPACIRSGGWPGCA